MGALLAWKLIGLAALGLFIASLMLALKLERTQNDKLKAQIERSQAELKRISTSKNDQYETTKGYIVKAGEDNKSADRIAKRIEAAPVVPGKCRTPEVIMGADL